MTKTILLSNEIWSLSLLPEYGACLTSCECLGFPVLRPGDLSRVEAGDIFASSCFPLIPYSNRIKNGEFSFGGKMFHIDNNHSEETFPIHGNVWEKSWQIQTLCEDSCELSLTYKPVRGGWPWAFEARQKITIKGSNLSFQLSIRNIDDTPFPAGLGLHPFFSGAISAKAKFSARNIWLCDDQLIPIESQAITPKNDFSFGKEIYGLTLDNCFDGWERHAEITWPDLGGVIRMESHPELNHLVVYIDRKNSFFCLEPVSHVNNALNMSGARSMNVLNPGKSFNGTIKFSFLR